VIAGAPGKFGVGEEDAAVAEWEEVAFGVAGVTGGGGEEREDEGLLGEGEGSGGGEEGAAGDH
jgi:hypothetical protein